MADSHLPSNHHITAVCFRWTSCSPCRPWRSSPSRWWSTTSLSRPATRGRSRPSGRTPSTTRSEAPTSTRSSRQVCRVRRHVGRVEYSCTDRPSWISQLSILRIHKHKHTTNDEHIWMSSWMSDRNLCSYLLFVWDLSRQTVEQK